MSVAAFSVDSANPLLAQPSSAGEALIARSTATGDTSQTLTIHGTSVTAGGYDSEGVSLLGQREIQFTNSGANDYDSLLHAKLSATCSGSVSIRAQGTAATGSIYVVTNPANNVTLTLGLTGFGQVYTFKTVLTGAANEIFIGATAADTADNIRRAINAAGTAGTHYGTGTVANAFASATVNTTVVTLTDRLACARGLAWTLTQSSTEFALISPTGGVNGTLLATIAAGSTQAYDDITLLNEDMGDSNLLAGLSFVSDWVNLGGESANINLLVAGTARAVSYETSTDAGVTARAGQTTLGSGGNAGSGTFYSHALAEGKIQYIRFSVNNVGTSAVACHCVVTY